MNRWTKLSIGTIVVVAIVYTLMKWPFTPKRSCEQVSNEMVQSEVKTDFLKKLPNYPAAQDTLGTANPTLAWGKVERNTDYKGKVLSIPFTATGKKGLINFIGIYTCESGLIEYSSEPKGGFPPLQ
ncbi:TPA: YebF family protein [Klebsiella pneumoniae]